MKKLISSLMLALAVVALPAFAVNLTGCSQNNKAEQLEDTGEEAVTEDMQDEYEKFEKEQNQPPSDQ